jgi:hypothetical protein
MSDCAAKRLMLQIADNYGELAIAAGSRATGGPRARWSALTRSR